MKPKKLYSKRNSLIGVVVFWIFFCNNEYSSKFKRIRVQKNNVFQIWSDKVHRYKLNTWTRNYIDTFSLKIIKFLSKLGEFEEFWKRSEDELFLMIHVCLFSIPPKVFPTNLWNSNECFLISGYILLWNLLKQWHLNLLSTNQNAGLDIGWLVVDDTFIVSF